MPPLILAPRLAALFIYHRFRLRCPTQTQRASPLTAVTVTGRGLPEEFSLQQGYGYVHLRRFSVTRTGFAFSLGRLVAFKPSQHRVCVKKDNGRSGTGAGGSLVSGRCFFFFFFNSLSLAASLTLTVSVWRLPASTDAVTYRNQQCFATIFARVIIINCHRYLT